MISLLLAALAAAPQSGDLATVLAQDGVSVQTSAGACPFRLWSGGPSRGVDGGWIISASAINPCAGASSVFIGRQPGQALDTIQLLREPQTINGYHQAAIGATGTPMRNGTICYSAATNLPPYVPSLWLDDQLLALRGDPVPSLPRTWKSFYSMHQTSTGGLLIHAEADGVGPSNDNGNVLFDWTNQQVLVAAKTSFPGLPGEINVFSPKVSLNGQHWAAIVRMVGTSDHAVIVDGAVYDFGVGLPAIQGGSLPPTLTTARPGSSWGGFWDIALSDRGDVVLYAETLSPSGPPQQHLLRNGVPVQRLTGSSVLLLKSVDSRGAILSSESGTRVLYAEGTPVYENDLGIDDDGDGVNDPQWEFVYQTAHTFAAPMPGEPTLFQSTIRPSGASFPRLETMFTVRNHRIDEPTCDGVPNSTGRAAELLVTGDRRVPENEIVIQAHSLPQETVGYFLMSRSSGMTVGAGGSQGNLCLAGSIGRLNRQIFSTGHFDQGKASIDLTAIPQPTGSVGASAGDTWYFQAWYRDSFQGSSTSNFSGAVSVDFD